MKKSDVLNIPNLLSLLRILMIPVFVTLFFRGGDYLYWAAGVLIASGLTDMLDGVIARHFHMITPLGQILDPVADKLTQGTIGVCMMIAYIRQPEIVALFVCFFLKEFAMGLGGVILLLKKKRPAPAQWYGKVATFSFYISIIIVVVTKAIFEYDKLWIVWVCVGLTAVMMIYAFVRYAGIFLRILRGTYVPDAAAPAKTQSTADV